MKLQEIFKNRKPIIGMIHLPPLIGYPKFRGVDFVIEKALKDLKNLEAGGVDGVMVENEEDHPHQIVVGPEIVACFTRVMLEIAENTHLPFGLQVLLNDPKASLAIAKISGASYIRSDYFVDKMYRKEYGEMKIDPQGLIDFKKKISAGNIAIFADIQVKYAKMLEEKNITISAKQAIKIGADAIIVTGEFTGEKPKIEDLKKVAEVAEDTSVLIGSGLNSKNAASLLKWADGAIVGTSFKVGDLVDVEKVIKLMKVVSKIRKR